MDQRLELQGILEDILGSENVYFQPSENIRMSYPCIVYSLSSDTVLRADNELYFRKKRYSIQIIDRNPDSPFPDVIAAQPLCSFERFFIADGLNHFQFSLFY